jgi:hypothetical protein
MDPHYASVSDDSGKLIPLAYVLFFNGMFVFSDEMYAAIEDRSGSDTYAQIVPLPQQQPPPPSVDSLRNTVAENHSRQGTYSQIQTQMCTYKNLIRSQ